MARYKILLQFEVHKPEKTNKQHDQVEWKRHQENALCPQDILGWLKVL